MSDAGEVRRKRVLFRAHHTGMKENDLLIGTFTDRHLAELDDAEVEWLEWLLMNHDDLDLYNWITGREPYAAVARTSGDDRARRTSSIPSNSH